jgi:hypothetical protein
VNATTGLLLLLKLVSLFSFSLLEEEEEEVEEEAANTHRRNTLGSTAAPDSALVNLAKHNFDVLLFISLAYSSNAVVCVHTAPPFLSSSSLISSSSREVLKLLFAAIELLCLCLLRCLLLVDIIIDSPPMRGALFPKRKEERRDETT